MTKRLKIERNISGNAGNYYRKKLQIFSDYVSYSRHPKEKQPEENHPKQMFFSGCFQKPKTKGN